MGPVLFIFYLFLFSTSPNNRTPFFLQSYNERNQWHHEEQKDADLIDGKTGVMNGVKGLNGEAEPSEMHFVHPVMGKNKSTKPDK